MEVSEPQGSEAMMKKLKANMSEEGKAKIVDSFISGGVDVQIAEEGGGFVVHFRHSIFGEQQVGKLMPPEPTLEDARKRIMQRIDELRKEYRKKITK
jgi:hypothetical protein